MGTKKKENKNVFCFYVLQNIFAIKNDTRIARVITFFLYLTFFVMRYVTDVVAVRRLFRFLGSGRVNHVADMGKREYTHLLDSQSAAHIAVFRLLIVFLSQVPRRATFSRPPFPAEMPKCRTTVTTTVWFRWVLVSSRLQLGSIKQNRSKELASDPCGFASGIGFGRGLALGIGFGFGLEFGFHNPKRGNVPRFFAHFQELNKRCT